MTVDEAAAAELAHRHTAEHTAFALRLMVAATDAAREVVAQDGEAEWITSPRGFNYRVVEL